MTDKQLVNSIRKTMSLSAKVGLRGGEGVRARLSSIGYMVLGRFPGDIIEIGAYTGETTKKLLQIARQCNRRVIVVDPWEPGTQNCKGKEYEKFLKNTQPYSDRLVVYRTRSDNPETIKAIKETPLALAFVDGLHTKEMCALDIDTVSHAGVICVDDLTHKHWGLLEVFGQKALEYDRCEITAVSKNIREGYLV